MRRPCATMLVAVLFLGQILVPARALARAVDQDDGSIPRSRFRISDATFADAAPQSSTLPRPSSPGGTLLRHALIGAAIGAGLTGVLAAGLSDCGSCSGETAKAMLSGAMYGALIGAAITIRPSWHSPSRRHAKIGLKLQKNARLGNAAPLPTPK